MDWSERKHYRKGSLIHTCYGYNKVISKIERDGTVITEDDRHCDFVHCCSAPKSREEIVNYFLKSWGSKKGTKMAKDYWPPSGGEVLDIVNRLKKGDRVFNKKGCLIHEV